MTPENGFKIIKEQLYTQCSAYVNQCLVNIQTAIDASNESGNNETKSSAGDKHETGRAMIQIEQEQYAKQRVKALEVKKMFDKINPLQNSKNVALGSLVITNKGDFYISISAGKITIENKNYYAISQASPFGLKLFGAKKNQQINFNNQVYRILDVV